MSLTGNDQTPEMPEFRNSGIAITTKAYAWIQLSNIFKSIIRSFIIDIFIIVNRTIWKSIKTIKHIYTITLSHGVVMATIQVNEKAKIDPLPHQNPLTDLHQTWHAWLFHGRHPTYKITSRSVRGFLFPKYGTTDDLFRGWLVFSFLEFLNGFLTENTPK